MQDKAFENFIRDIPKVELHVHIEAVTSFQSYQKLNKSYKVDSRLTQATDYKRFLEIDSLADMIKNFTYLQTFFQRSEDFAMMVQDQQRYMAGNNIQYAEVFFSPSMQRMNGRNIHEVYTVLTTEAQRVFEESDHDIKFIVDISRSFGFENAKQNLDDLLAILPKLRHGDRIIGIGLGGQESGNPAHPYAPLFERAQKEGLHTVAHAGEEEDSRSIWDAVSLLKAERIGHATSAQFDKELMNYLREAKLPLEICPTSNLVTKKYVQAMEGHPLRDYLRDGLFVTLHTDDPVLFDIELIEEYKNVFYKMELSVSEMLQVVRNNIDASFLPRKQKKKLHARTNAELRRHFPELAASHS